MASFFMGAVAMFSRVRDSQFDNAIDDERDEILKQFIKDWRSTVSATALYDAIINQGVASDVLILLNNVDAVAQEEHANVGRMTLAARLVLACEKHARDESQPMIKGMKNITVQGKNYAWRESFQSYWTFEDVHGHPSLKRLTQSGVKGPVTAWEGAEAPASRALKM
jgi:hypothetical protein